MTAPDRRVLATVLVVALVLAGAVAFLGSDDGSELPNNSTAIQQTVSDRVANLESYRVTMVQSVTYGDTTQRVRMRLAYESGRYNLTYLETPAGRQPIFLANQTTQWYYDTGEDVVRRRPRNQSRSTNLLVRITESLFDHRNVTYDGSETIEGTETVQLSYSQYDRTISLAVGGKEASLLTAPDSEIGNASTRIWIDAQRRLPVRARTTATHGNETVVRTVRLTNVSLGVDVPDERFAAPPVEGVPIVTEQHPDVTRYHTRAALARNASGSLVTAAVPDSFEFSYGLRVHEANGTTVSQVYSDGISRLGVIRTDPQITDDAVDPNTTVAGRPAEFERQYVHYGHGRVRWRCGDDEYFVSAPVDVALSKEQLIEVAASVGCPDETGSD
ncbi:outer membrane lipoprotein carrier protein LolA [Halorientalis brevis]|uniref:Outer membrane lipoprotein carrier protein LolA n=1 Tax=Halorientalis brevis TaxID=1126241 RepID=A0ABD6CA19_9EURY|nr:hypothetical protein [Halorientalis brevis]